MNTDWVKIEPLNESRNINLHHEIFLLVIHAVPLISAKQGRAKKFKIRLIKLVRQIRLIRLTRLKNRVKNKTKKTNIRLI